MSKGERTRAEIVATAAPIFNRQGYAGASISDVMRQTGLEKGGIYNHFSSKEELALAVFDYSWSVVSERMIHFIRSEKAPGARLIRIIQFFTDYYEDPPISGGCVLLNTAVDSDDTQPALRERAREAMTQWRSLVERTVRRGVKSGEIRPDVDPEGLATLVMATVEGAVMLSQLYDDLTYIHQAVDHLVEYVTYNVLI